MAAMCLTEQRNLKAATVGDGGDVWTAGPSGPQKVAASSRNASHAAMRQVERMLQSYEREISSVESTLREMEENLATTRQEGMLGGRQTMMGICASSSSISIITQFTCYFFSDSSVVHPMNLDAPAGTAFA